MLVIIGPKSYKGASSDKTAGAADDKQKVINFN